MAGPLAACEPRSRAAQRGQQRTRKFAAQMEQSRPRDLAAPGRASPSGIHIRHTGAPRRPAKQRPKQEHAGLITTGYGGDMIHTTDTKTTVGRGREGAGRRVACAALPGRVS
jgi:hypothetical protein